MLLLHCIVISLPISLLHIAGARIHTNTFRARERVRESREWIGELLSDLFENGTAHRCIVYVDVCTCSATVPMRSTDGTGS